MINPNEDGVTHINVYTKGLTTLGKMLSNLYQVPRFAFTCPHTNRVLHLTSVEQYWYYRRLIQYKTHEELQPIFLLNGFEAKKFGQAMQLNLDMSDKSEDQEDFRKDILACIRMKLLHNKSMQDMLQNSTLPFKHYYVYGKVTELPQYNWMLDYFDEVRIKLKNFVPKMERLPIIKLTGKTVHTTKDQLKADQADYFIGVGCEDSSTNQYCKDYGLRANLLNYPVQKPRIFVSVNGSRKNAIPISYSAFVLDIAISMNAIFYTDNLINRNRSFNTGERALAKYLESKDYTFTDHKEYGTWEKKQ